MQESAPKSFDCFASIENMYKRNDRNRKEKKQKILQENENLLMKIFAEIFFLKSFAKEKKEGKFILIGFEHGRMKGSFSQVTTIKWVVIVI